MRMELVEALHARRAEIRTRWADLLRADRATTPLAHPEALVHLIDWSLDEIQSALKSGLQRRRLGRSLGHNECRIACACQRNPLLGYFSAGCQALREALILSQVALSDLTPGERDSSMEELNLVLHVIAQREIEAFCSVCQYRQPGSPASALSHSHSHTESSI